MKTIIAFTLIALLIGYSVGYYYGTWNSLNWCAEKSIYFLNLKGIKLDINEEIITAGLFMYKDKLDGYFPTQNASILNNTGD